MYLAEPRRLPGNLPADDVAIGGNRCRIITHMIAEAAATMPAGFIEGPVEPTMLSIGELRNPGGLSGDDPNVRYINGRVVRVGTPGRSNRGLR